MSRKTRFLSGISIAVALALACPTSPSNAQAQVLTVAALFAEADQLVKDLNNVVSNAGDQLRATAGDLSTEVNGLEGQIKNDVSDLSTSVNNVGANAQNSVNTLQYIVQNVGDLISKQRACLDLDINLLESGLQTTVEQAKLGVPFVKTSSARLDEFVFDGHTPNVVPEAGGPVTLRGFKLWQNRPPLVTLTQDPADDSPIVTLAAARQSNDAITTSVPATIINAHAGECLYLKVTTRHPAIFDIGTAEGETSSMPFCIPATAITEYQISTTVRYSCAGQTTSTYTSPMQNVSYATCEGGNVPVGGNFPIPVPPSCSITGAQALKGNLTRREASTTSVAISGQTVVLSSLLSPAACSGPWKHLSQTSDWQYEVQATISCPTSNPANVLNPRSPWIAAAARQTQLSVDTAAKSCIPQGNTSDVNVQVFRIVRSTGQPVGASTAQPSNNTLLAGGSGMVPTAPQIGTKIYDQSGSQPGGSTLVLPPASFGSTITDAQYTPGSGSLPAHVGATVTVQSCGY